MPGYKIPESSHTIDPDENIRKDLFNRIEELNEIRAEIGIELLRPLLFDNPPLDDSIVGITKYGQIVYDYGFMIDLYAENLISFWEEEKTQILQSEKYQRLNQDEKDTYLSEKINCFYKDCYTKARFFLDEYNLKELNQTGTELFFDEDVEENPEDNESLKDNIPMGCSYYDQIFENSEETTHSQFDFEESDYMAVKPLVIYPL